MIPIPLLFATTFFFQVVHTFHQIFDVFIILFYQLAAFYLGIKSLMISSGNRTYIISWVVFKRSLDTLTSFSWSKPTINF